MAAFADDDGGAKRSKWKFGSGISKSMSYVLIFKFAHHLC